MDPRALVFLVAIAAWLVLSAAWAFAKFLRRRNAARWCRALAKGTLVFALLFFLQGWIAVLAPYVLDRFGMTTVARYIDEPILAIPFGLIAAAFGSVAFRDRFHRDEPPDETSR